MTKKTTTEKLSEGHRMKWAASSKPAEMRILGSPNTGEVLLLLRGGADSGAMLSQADLCPEYQEAINEFRQSEAAEKIQSLRNRLQHNADCRAELGPHIQELQQQVESETDLDAADAIDSERDYARQDLARLDRQRAALEKAIFEAYRVARRALEASLTKAAARILDDARQGKAAALDRLGPAAAGALTLLVLAHARQQAAGKVPSVEAVLGPDPSKQVPVVTEPVYGQTPGVFEPAGAAVA